MCAVAGRFGARTCGNLAGVRGCKDVWHARCAETCRVSAGARASPHCHCEERSDVAIRIPCGSAKRTAVLWANAGKCNEFALSTTNLPGFPAGTRIAAPVCALVRNDMQKTERRLRLQGRGAQGAQKLAGRQRVQGRLARKVRRNLPGVSGCKGLPPLSLRGAKRRGNPFSSQ